MRASQCGGSPFFAVLQKRRSSAVLRRADSCAAGRVTHCVSNLRAERPTSREALARTGRSPGRRHAATAWRTATTGGHGCRRAARAACLDGTRRMRSRWLDELRTRDAVEDLVTSAATPNRFSTVTVDRVGCASLNRRAEAHEPPQIRPLWSFADERANPG